MICIEVMGIPCEFNEDALDDFDMLEHMEAMENGNATALVSFARGIFGEEQLSNIKSQLKGDDGICHLATMTEFIGEAMNEAAKSKRAELKN